MWTPLLVAPLRRPNRDPLGSCIPGPSRNVDGSYVVHRFSVNYLVSNVYFYPCEVKYKRQNHFLSTVYFSG